MRTSDPSAVFGHSASWLAATLLAWSSSSSSKAAFAGARSRIEQSTGSPKEAAHDIPDGSVDAFLSTYVLDILSDEDIHAVLSLAVRSGSPCPNCSTSIALSNIVQAVNAACNACCFMQAVAA